MAEPIVVVGAGGFGRETLDVVDAINRAGAGPAWHVLGVVDDGPEPINLDRLIARGYRHLGDISDVLVGLAPAAYVVGIGDPNVRARIASKFDRRGWRAATLVHPSAVVGSSARIEPGVVICGGVQLSTNTRLGRHAHLNPGCIVGHDSNVGEFVSINPGAIISGDVTVETGVLVGAGATVLQGLRLGRGGVVGAGACVTRSTEQLQTVVGVPARPVPDRGPV
ncbi:NeuD/PglB/VioB family sugar acetyltransferase [Microbacterium sp. RD1]|uniref:NeuD/PglB/VioB family sugar acetyltransferase n=1 Tax=Microbacterium sp. RD1 TaxID=3457313 RepID=UPI003FA572F9